MSLSAFELLAFEKAVEYRDKLSETNEFTTKTLEQCRLSFIIGWQTCAVARRAKKSTTNILSKGVHTTRKRGIATISNSQFYSPVALANMAIKENIERELTLSPVKIIDAKEIISTNLNLTEKARATVMLLARKYRKEHGVLKSIAQCRRPLSEKQVKVVFEIVADIKNAEKDYK